MTRETATVQSMKSLTEYQFHLLKRWFKNLGLSGKTLREAIVLAKLYMMCVEVADKDRGSVFNFMLKTTSTDDELYKRHPLLKIICPRSFGIVIHPAVLKDIEGIPEFLRPPLEFIGLIPFIVFVGGMTKFFGVDEMDQDQVYPNETHALVSLKENGKFFLMAFGLVPIKNAFIWWMILVLCVGLLIVNTGMIGISFVTSLAISEVSGMTSYVFQNLFEAFGILSSKNRKFKCPISDFGEIATDPEPYIKEHGLEGSVLEDILKAFMKDIFSLLKTGLVSNLLKCNKNINTPLSIVGELVIKGHHVCTGTSLPSSSLIMFGITYYGKILDPDYVASLSQMLGFGKIINPFKFLEKLMLPVVLHFTYPFSTPSMLKMNDILRYACMIGMHIPTNIEGLIIQVNGTMFKSKGGPYTFFRAMRELLKQYGYSKQVIKKLISKFCSPDDSAYFDTHSTAVIRVLMFLDGFRRFLEEKKIDKKRFHCILTEFNDNVPGLDSKRYGWASMTQFYFEETGQTFDMNPSDWGREPYEYYIKNLRAFLEGFNITSDCEPVTKFKIGTSEENLELWIALKRFAITSSLGLSRGKVFEGYLITPGKTEKSGKQIKCRVSYLVIHNESGCMGFRVSVEGETDTSYIPVFCAKGANGVVPPDTHVGDFIGLNDPSVVKVIPIPADKFQSFVLQLPEF